MVKHNHMKSLAALLLLATTPIRAELKFDSPVIDANAATDDKIVMREFKFTNSGANSGLRRTGTPGMTAGRAD